MAHIWPKKRISKKQQHCVRSNRHICLIELQTSQQRSCRNLPNQYVLVRIVRQQELLHN